jgi:hypothetical protein
LSFYRSRKFGSSHRSTHQPFLPANLGERRASLKLYSFLSPAGFGAGGSGSRNNLNSILSPAFSMSVHCSFVGSADTQANSFEPSRSVKRGVASCA